MSGYRPRDAHTYGSSAGNDLSFLSRVPYRPHDLHTYGVSAENDPNSLSSVPYRAPADRTGDGLSRKADDTHARASLGQSSDTLNNASSTHWTDGESSPPREQLPTQQDPRPAAAPVKPKSEVGWLTKLARDTGYIDDSQSAQQPAPLFPPPPPRLNFNWAYTRMLRQTRTTVINTMKEFKVSFADAFYNVTFWPGGEPRGVGDSTPVPRTLLTAEMHEKLTVQMLVDQSSFEEAYEFVAGWGMNLLPDAILVLTGMDRCHLKWMTPMKWEEAESAWHGRIWKARAQSEYHIWREWPAPSLGHLAGAWRSMQGTAPATTSRRRGKYEGPLKRVKWGEAERVGGGEDWEGEGAFCF